MCHRAQHKTGCEPCVHNAPFPFCFLGRKLSPSDAEHPASVYMTSETDRQSCCH